MHIHIIFPFILGIRNTHTYIRSRPAHPQSDAPGGFFTGEDSLSHGDYSHSMVPGGLEVTSSTTRLTSLTSFVMRFEILASRS